MAPDLVPAASKSDLAPKQCLLLSLPFELRSMIFAYAVREDSKIIYKSIETRNTSRPAITRSCRQMREEALPLYFTHNQFSFKYNHTSWCIPTEISSMTHFEINCLSIMTTILLRVVKGVWEVEVRPDRPATPCWQAIFEPEIQGAVDAWIIGHNSTKNARITKLECHEFLNGIHSAVRKRLIKHCDEGL